MVALTRMKSRIPARLRTLLSSNQLETRRCSIESTVVAHEYEHEEKPKMSPRGRDANACTCSRRKSSRRQEWNQKQWSVVTKLWYGDDHSSDDAVSIIDDCNRCVSSEHCSDDFWRHIPSVPRRIPLPIHMPVFRCKYLVSPVSMWM